MPGLPATKKLTTTLGTDSPTALVATVRYLYVLPGTTKVSILVETDWSTLIHGESIPFIPSSL
jgi:hypothetical protein